MDEHRLLQRQYEMRERAFHPNEQSWQDGVAASPRRLASPDVTMALVTEHPNKPGEIESIASEIGGKGINVCGFLVRREDRKDGRAVLITLLDRQVGRETLTALESLGVRPRVWHWENREDLDLSDVPISIPVNSRFFRILSNDRPGRITRIASFFKAHGLAASGFLVGRSMNRVRAEHSLPVRAEREAATPRDEGGTILAFFGPGDGGLDKLTDDLCITLTDELCNHLSHSGGVLKVSCYRNLRRNGVEPMKAPSETGDNLIWVRVPGNGVEGSG
jgi:hypothetical protein